ncbi:pre-rRNA-processing protein ipi1 [Trichophyton rubrum]|uniref:Pre-rRNA-processing protein n=4 Tax=Trichophyton TaxID=5550 RepID=A0A178F252_TRIRU|nr:Pre-rRNA-processing protein IPI1/Testis-expressed sequence 10 protein [Trichophyton rubrum]OAL66371.1 pre-rRNA-processing protein ipi1 [Trichophyton rubrum]
MGSSQKKKNEKKKDFQKTKLKVGKKKAAPSNFTNTSFKSKAIVLNQQSLSTSAPSESSQFIHSLSLLGSKTDTQRKESLSHLTTAISSRPVDSPLPRPVGVILPLLFPLILDGNNGVRTQLLKLLKVLPRADLEGHVSTFLPYVRAGMTHLAADIRLSSVEILSWLLSVAGQELVSAAGGWVKTLNCFLSLLGWHTESSTKWSSNKTSFGKSGSEGKLTARVLQIFAEFLQAGIGKPDEQSLSKEGQGVNDSQACFPLRHVQYHLLPTKSSPFSYLDLFGSIKSEEADMYESREDRLRVFTQIFHLPVQRGLDAARQDGGEIGRVSAAARKVLRDCNLPLKS